MGLSAAAPSAMLLIIIFSRKSNHEFLAKISIWETCTSFAQFNQSQMWSMQLEFNTMKIIQWHECIMKILVSMGRIMPGWPVNACGSYVKSQSHPVIAFTILLQYARFCGMPKECMQLTMVCPSWLYVNKTGCSAIIIIMKYHLISCQHHCMNMDTR